MHWGFGKEATLFLILDGNKETFIFFCYWQYSCYHKESQSSHEAAMKKNRLEGEKEPVFLLTMIQNHKI